MPDEKEQNKDAPLTQEGVKTGLREAIELVQQLGKASNGQPLTPGFIAFKLTQHLRSKE
jgi:hypothetical protein